MPVINIIKDCFDALQDDLMSGVRGVSVIQATRTVKFEDDLRIGNQFEAKNNLQKVRIKAKINAANDFLDEVDQVAPGTD